MSDVSVFLLCVSAIFLIGIVGELVFAKTGVPDVIWLIVVGAVLGPISGLVSKAMLQSIAPYFGALTLVIVLFNGGTGLKLRELSAAAALFRDVLAADPGDVVARRFLECCDGGP